jgi:hypothetical protein
MIALQNTVFTLDEKSRMPMWKIKCLGMFAVPPPLFWRGGWEVRPKKSTNGQLLTTN